MTRTPTPSASPPVSVVIPAYNREGSIVAAIESVLAQSWRDFELVVVDDGSRDGTLAAARSVADPRLRVIAAPRNGGAATARNLGADRGARRPGSPSRTATTSGCRGSSRSRWRACSRPRDPPRAALRRRLLRAADPRLARRAARRAAAAALPARPGDHRRRRRHPRPAAGRQPDLDPDPGGAPRPLRRPRRLRPGHHADRGLGLRDPPRRRRPDRLRRRAAGACSASRRTRSPATAPARSPRPSASSRRTPAPIARHPGPTPSNATGSPAATGRPATSPPPGPGSPAPAAPPDAGTAKLWAMSLGVASMGCSAGPRQAARP